MTRQEIENFIEKTISTASVILADDLDEAFVGIDVEHGPPRAVYSIEKCINLLAQDMSTVEADEYFWNNVAGSLGDGLPIYISTPEEEEESPYD